MGEGDFITCPLIIFLLESRECIYLLIKYNNNEDSCYSAKAEGCHMGISGQYGQIF